MSITFRRAVLTLLALILLPLGVAACGGDDDNTSTAASGGADKQVTLRVGVQKDGIRAVLGKSGQLENLPYEIEWSTFQAGPPLVEAAGADKIDIAWVGCAPPIFGAAAGSDFKAIAAVQERDRQENRLLVPSDSDIRSIADLKGKKIAVPKGTSGHAFILNALGSEGLGTDDVEFAFLAPPDALAAYQNGAVDAISIWDPFAIQAQETLGAREIVAGEPYESGFGFEIASSKSLEDPDKVAAIKDYVRRLGAAWEWAGEHPDEWAAAWTQDTRLPLAVTRLAARRKASDIVPLDDAIIATEQRLADLFADEGELPGKVEFADIVDTSVLGAGGSGR